MKIGHIDIGIHGNKKAWKHYLTPKYCCGGKWKHTYFQYYIRWFNIYWCKPRKCENCGNYMVGDGHHIWDKEGDKILITVCRDCYKEKGYNGWIDWAWDQQTK